VAKSLVERLNSWTHDPMAAAASDLMDEAAAEIEDLQEQVASLQSRIEELEGQLEHSKQVAWNRLSAAEKDEAIRRG